MNFLKMNYPATELRETQTLYIVADNVFASFNYRRNVSISPCMSQPYLSAQCQKNVAVDSKLYTERAISNILADQLFNRVIIFQFFSSV